MIKYRICKLFEWEMIQFSEKLSPQYHQAIINARILSQEIGDAELTFVGHSLGGGEAAAASMATGITAITFNPAAVGVITRLIHGLGSSNNITNYRIIPEGNQSIRLGGCIVNNLQDNLGFKAPGQTIRISNNVRNPFEAHKLNNFIDYFKSK